MWQNQGAIFTHKTEKERHQKNRESKQNDSMIVVARREAKFESFSQT